MIYPISTKFLHVYFSQMIKEGVKCRDLVINVYKTYESSLNKVLRGPSEMNIQILFLTVENHSLLVSIFISICLKKDLTEIQEILGLYFRQVLISIIPSLLLYLFLFYGYFLLSVPLKGTKRIPLPPPKKITLINKIFCQFLNKKFVSIFFTKMDFLKHLKYS